MDCGASGNLVKLMTNDHYCMLPADSACKWACGGQTYLFYKRSLSVRILCAETLSICLPGPVDAAYKAIDGLVRVDAELVDYSVNSVTEGIQALATTRVTIRPTGQMKDEAYVVRAGGFGGKVQRTFSGGRDFVAHLSPFAPAVARLEWTQQLPITSAIAVC